MKLSKDVLDIDLEFETEKLVNLIASTNSILKRSGVLIPLSGGVDSTTALYLAIEAVGVNNVTGWFAPYNDVTDPTTISFIKAIQEDTGVKIIQDNNLASILGQCNVQKPSESTSNELRKLSIDENRMFYRDGTLVGSLSMDVHTNMILGFPGDNMKKTGHFYSSLAAQHYFREAMVKTLALQHNATLVCCSNKTETDIGWYTKGGVDDTGDVKPIIGLYKTQVNDLAKHLDIVNKVAMRAPTSDMGIGGDNNAGLPDYVSIDLVLKGYNELGMTPKQIFEETKIPMGEIVKLVLRSRRSDHMRNGAFTSEDIGYLNSRSPNYFNCVDVNLSKQ